MDRTDFKHFCSASKQHHPIPVVIDGQYMIYYCICINWFGAGILHNDPSCDVSCLYSFTCKTSTWLSSWLLFHLSSKLLLSLHDVWEHSIILWPLKQSLPEGLHLGWRMDEQMCSFWSTSLESPLKFTSNLFVWDFTTNCSSQVKFSDLELMIRMLHICLHIDPQWVDCMLAPCL